LPKKINWIAIRDDFVKSADLTYTALATRHGVSRQAIEKRASDESWQVLRQAYRCEQSMNAENRDDELNLELLLKKALIKTSQQLEKAEAKSLEKVIEGFVKLAELHLRLHPPTAEKWATLGLEFGLEPIELAKHFREQWNMKKK
jgi:hypothetical protein